MFELNSVLCPIDFSERSRAATLYAGALACHFHAHLHLVHVVQPHTWATPDIGAPVIENLLDVEREDARRRLESLLPEAGIQVERVVLEGDAALKIVDYASSEHVGMIVMPTHGYGPFRRFLLGSVTAKVLHDAECPVLTSVHMDESSSKQNFGMSRIVCAVDLGPDSERVLRWADRFARTFGSRLTTVNISQLKLQADPGERMTLIEEARADMEDLRNATGTDSDVLADTGGDVVQAICSTALRLDANVTVIGRGGFGKSIGRLRANSYAIIRQSHCPVISI